MKMRMSRNRMKATLTALHRGVEVLEAEAADRALQGNPDRDLNEIARLAREGLRVMLEREAVEAKE